MTKCHKRCQYCSCFLFLRSKKTFRCLQQRWQGAIPWAPVWSGGCWLRRRAEKRSFLYQKAFLKPAIWHKEKRSFDEAWGAQHAR